MESKAENVNTVLPDGVITQFVIPDFREFKKMVNLLQIQTGGVIRIVVDDHAVTFGKFDESHIVFAQAQYFLDNIEHKFYGGEPYEMLIDIDQLWGQIKDLKVNSTIELQFEKNSIGIRWDKAHANGQDLFTRRVYVCKVEPKYYEQQLTIKPPELEYEQSLLYDRVADLENALNIVDRYPKTETFKSGKTNEVHQVTLTVDKNYLWLMGEGPAIALPHGGLIYNIPVVDYSKIIKADFHNIPDKHIVNDIQEKTSVFSIDKMPIDRLFADEILFTMGNDMPLVLTQLSENANVTWLIAPRIESEE